MITSQHSKRKIIANPAVRTALSRRGLAASLGGLATIFGYANQAHAAPTAGGLISDEDLGIVHVRRFGAKGDDMSNDTGPIQAAIDFAQNFSGRTGRNLSVMLGPGIFRVHRSLNISGANRGIAILGSPWASLQQGSALPVSTIRWIGEAYPVFNVTSTFTHFISFAIVNNGSATSAIKFTTGGRALLFGMSFVPLDGASAFKDAAVWFDGFAYDFIDRCEFEVSPAVKITGKGTTLEITRCVFDDSGDFPYTDNPILNVDAEMDLLKIERNTFNHRPNANVVFDNFASNKVITLMRVVANEFDAGGLTSDKSSRIILGNNVLTLTFEDNQVAGFGDTSSDSLIQLANSRARVSGNWGSSIASPLVKTVDATSRVFVGPNNFNILNTRGILDDESQSGGIVDVPLAPPGQAKLRGNLGSPSSETVYRIFATSTNSIEVVLAELEDSLLPGYMTKGQRFTVMLLNISGAPLMNPSTVIFNSNQFRTSGSFISQQQPLNNRKNRSIAFVFDGTHAVELWRGAADVDNSVA